MDISYAYGDDDDFLVVKKAETHAAAGRIYGDFARVGEAYQVYIARDALKRILRHAQSGYEETGGEIAGALIGSLQYDSTADITFVEINEAVPVQSSTANFDVAIDPTEWSKAEDVTQEPQFRGRCVVVGWYHSHPNIGIFLSLVDLNTQATHFSMPWQIGIVVDPVRMEIGAFNGPAGTPCPLYVIPAAGDVALTAAAVALAHLDDPPAVVRAPPWRSPLVLAVAGVLVLALLALGALFLNASSSAASTSAKATEDAQNQASFLAGHATETAAIEATLSFIDGNNRVAGTQFAQENAQAYGTLTAVAGQQDAQSLAIQGQVLANMTAEASAYYATATAGVVALNNALSSAQNGQTATVAVAQATSVAGAAVATRGAVSNFATLTAISLARGGELSSAQQTQQAGAFAQLTASSQGLTATAAAVAASRTALANQPTPTFPPTDPPTDPPAPRPAAGGGVSNTATRVASGSPPSATPRVIHNPPTAVPTVPFVPATNTQPPIVPTKTAPPPAVPTTTPVPPTATQAHGQPPTRPPTVPPTQPAPPPPTQPPATKPPAPPPTDTPVPPPTETPVPPPPTRPPPTRPPTQPPPSDTPVPPPTATPVPPPPSNTPVPPPPTSTPVPPPTSTPPATRPAIATPVPTKPPPPPTNTPGGTDFTDTSVPPLLSDTPAPPTKAPASIVPLPATSTAVGGYPLIQPAVLAPDLGMDDCDQSPDSYADWCGE